MARRWSADPEIPLWRMAIITSFTSSCYVFWDWWAMVIPPLKGFLWDSYGIPMRFLWDSYGIPYNGDILLNLYVRILVTIAFPGQINHVLNTVYTYIIVACIHHIPILIPFLITNVGLIHGTVIAQMGKYGRIAIYCDITSPTNRSIGVKLSKGW